MRILFLSDNFPPEVNAPASRTFEHCREWVKAGHEVVVITSAPNFPQGKVYEGYKNRLYQKEILEGITVIRVWTFVAPNAGFALRILDYLSYACAAVIAAMFQKADVIVATSPQFFTACAGYVASLLKRKPWIFEVRDLWPESIKAVGAMKDSFVIRMLERLELFLYHRATKIVSVTDSFKERIAARGVSREKISVVKNGVERNQFSLASVDRSLKEQLGLEEKFVLSYIGTHGMAHALDFILHVAGEMQTKGEFSKVHFLLIGAGAEKEKLFALKEELQLSNITMLEPVPKEEVANYLAMSDVALVNLKRSETFLTVIPSKIFEAAAVQVPILLGVDGEARQLVEEYHAGIFFEPENAEQLQTAITRLMSDHDLLRQLQNGCNKLADDFSRERQAVRMLEELQQVIGQAQAQAQGKGE